MKTVKIKRAISLLCLLFFSLFMNGQQATGYTKARNYTAEKIIWTKVPERTVMRYELFII